jgi:hypothetical protein
MISICSRVPEKYRGTQDEYLLTVLHKVRCPIRRKFFISDPDVYEVLKTTSYRKVHGERSSVNTRATAHTVWLFFEIFFDREDPETHRVAPWLVPEHRDKIFQRLAELGQIDQFNANPSIFADKARNAKVSQL